LVCNKKYAEKIALKNHTKLQVRKGKTTRWEKSQGDIHEPAHMQINRQQKRQDNVANAPRLHCLHSHKHARHTHLLGSSVVAFNSRTFFCLTEPTKKQRLSSSPSFLNGESCSSLFANAFPEFFSRRTTNRSRGPTTTEEVAAVVGFPNPVDRMLP